MSRTARLDAPGVLHHVMIRGIERRKIFRNNKDREDFIERLAKLCPSMKINCYAWSFLPNHAHFLFQTGQEPLSKLMRRLLTGYVLGYFGKSKEKARKEYESFVKKGFSQGRKNELTGGGLIRSLGGWIEAKEILKSGIHVMSDERILGDSDFVDSIIMESEDHYERRHRLKRLGYDLERIAERVAEVLRMEPDEVYSRGRQAKKVKARSLLCFWASRELGMSHTSLAKKLEMSLANIGLSVE